MTASPTSSCERWPARAPSPLRSGDVLGKGKVVLFAVPGAFTPTCSDYHLPGFVHRADELQAKGVDTIACVSVNDPFVMGAWGRDQKVGDKVLMLADGNGEFTRAMGLEADMSGAGLGRPLAAVRGGDRGRGRDGALRRARTWSERQLGRVRAGRPVARSVPIASGPIRGADRVRSGCGSAARPCGRRRSRSR